MRIFLIILLPMVFNACNQVEKDTAMDFTHYDSYPIYDGQLFLQYTASATVFRLWSPTAEAVVLQLYENGEAGQPLTPHHLQMKESGVWELKINRDLEGLFYTYQVKVNGEVQGETPGIYANAVGVNGRRAAIIDFEKTNPVGWELDKRPQLNSVNDIILYELHVRDFTVHKSAGSRYPGKYLGLVETGTKNKDGQPTGISHIKGLGVTHVHLLPVFDYMSVDEAKLNVPQFNWGYDPQNYNVPEGSYATDPYKPEVRIKEFKQMVKGFHDQGIRVVMDVVYNHTGGTENANFNLEVPGYYYRHNEEGSFSNASACGNETASERPMMRKFIVESVKYWAKEYHIDGFRFDLMGIHDLETMNAVSAALNEIDPTIFVYGEGWAAGDSPLSVDRRAVKSNTVSLHNVAAFSDDIRDAIKGSVFDFQGKGFVNGETNMEESIKFGIVGATNHPQIDYKEVNYSTTYWANKPSQCINYVSCHDNHTLWDKLKISTSNSVLENGELERMHKMANAIVLTAQGIPFLHAGVELKRSKNGEHNSYNLPDSINQVRWDLKDNNLAIFDYYKGLVNIRKAHPAFRMSSANMIAKNLQFIESTVPGLVAYAIQGSAVGDSWEEILVIFNANIEKVPIAIPNGKWTLVVDENEVNENGIINITGPTIDVPPIATYVMFR